MIKQSISFLVLAFLLLLPSCEPRHKQDVLILYPNWADGIAVTHLAEVVLKDKGYTVTLKRLEPGPIYASISRGDADVYMDAWLPHTHKDYWDRFGKRTEVLGTIFDDGITGLVVPTYVDINSIDELNANKDKFDGKIYGIASGAGIFKTTENAIEVYQLSYNQLPSSETSMITALKKAVHRKEWIVITGWKPHYIWSEFDLKPLVDPKGVYPKDEIKTVAREGFTKDQPEIAAFFAKFKLNEKMLNELMDLTNGDRDPSKGAQVFYEKYKDEIETWLVPKKVDKQ